MLRRQKLARVIATGKAKTATHAMELVGYSRQTALKKQSSIINSPEVQNELIRLGFTEQHAKARIASIMNAPLVAEMITPDNQLRASELALRAFGALGNEKQGNTTNILNVFSPEQARAIAERILNMNNEEPKTQALGITKI